MAIIHLPDRAMISVHGPDAAHFLQNLVTTDIDLIEENQAWPGALLTPQGKIYFAFLIARDGEGFTLETHEDEASALVQRLSIYKLRAKVTLETIEIKGMSVYLGDDAAPLDGGVRDMRFARAGMDVYRQPGRAEEAVSEITAYTMARIEAGAAEIHSDYQSQDVFPHDVLFDKNGGVSFRKGCYIGQEVVSRMQHRGTARRRLVHISAETDLPASGTELTISGKTSGQMGSVSGKNALAIVRTDRVAQALASGTQILAGENPVTVTPFAWSGITFDLQPDGE